MQIIRSFMLSLFLISLSSASHAAVSIYPNCTFSRNTYTCVGNSTRVVNAAENCAQDFDRTVISVNPANPVCAQGIQTIVNNWVKIRAAAGTNPAAADRVFRNYIAAINKINQLSRHFSPQPCARIVSYTPIRGACGAGPTEGGSFDLP